MLEIIKESWARNIYTRHSLCIQVEHLIIYHSLFIYLFIFVKEKKSALGLQNKRKR